MVRRGELAWPPTDLIQALGTFAGCLALAGPLIIRRDLQSEIGLGDLLWVAGGLLIALTDSVALIRGQYRSVHWAMPLGAETMGLVILAVGLAVWRAGLARPGWSWTNLTGCALACFWVSTAVASLWPARLGLLSLR